MFHPAHYQWQSTIRDIRGQEGGIVYGKKEAFNDFCGAVFFRGKAINWIGRGLRSE